MKEELMIGEKEILEWYNSSDDKPFYGYMYGYPSGRPFADDLIGIRKGEVELITTRTGERGFLYVWGWPGPDCNFYNIADYGKTWAFSIDELASAQMEL